MVLAYGIDRLPGILHQRRQAPKGVGRTETPAVAAAALAGAVSAGRLADAVAQYALLEGKTERSQVDTGSLLAIGEYLLDIKQSDQARMVFRRLISERPGDASLDRAYLGAGKAMLQKARCDTSAWHYFVAAVDLAKTPALAEEARSYMRSIERCRD